ncbi:hypothetical protein CSUI_004725, partial [Cystoisospora suis]
MRRLTTTSLLVARSLRRFVFGTADHELPFFSFSRLLPTCHMRHSFFMLSLHHVP